MSSDDILRIVFGSSFCVTLVCLVFVLVFYAFKVGYKMDKLKIKEVELRIKALKKYLCMDYFDEDDK